MLDLEMQLFRYRTNRSRNLVLYQRRDMAAIIGIRQLQPIRQDRLTRLVAVSEIVL